MIKALFWVGVGAVGALQADRWMDGLWERVRPRAMTDAMFERVNQRLERNRLR